MTTEHLIQVKCRKILNRSLITLLKPGKNKSYFLRLAAIITFSNRAQTVSGPTPPFLGVIVKSSVHKVIRQHHRLSYRLHWLHRHQQQLPLL